MKDVILGIMFGVLIAVFGLAFYLQRDCSHRPVGNLAVEVAEMEQERDELRTELEKAIKVIAAAEAVIEYGWPNGYWRGEVNMNGSVGPLRALKNTLERMNDE